MPVPITPPEIDLRLLRSRVKDPGLLADELGSSAWLRRAHIVKSDERSSVLSGDVAGRGVIVKTLVTSPVRSRAPGGFGRTRLSRQWRGAELLREHGLPTVEPVLMWSGRSSKGHYAETLVLERVEGRTLIGSIADPATNVREQHLLAEEVGALTARLVREGLFNRDHKPSNIIVRAAGSDGSAGRLVLIDTAGVTRLGSRRPERMLFNLAVELVGTGTLPRRGVVMRALDSYRDHLSEHGTRPGGNGSPHQTRVIWEAVERMLAGHADPTPKDDPLRY